MKVDPTDRSRMFYWQSDRPFTEAEIKKIFLDRQQNFNLQLAKAAIEYGMAQAGKKTIVKKLFSIIPFGSVNVVIKAELSNGLKIIFRSHPLEIKNGYFWAEGLAAQTVKKLGVPCYETYFIDDSREKFNFDYMLTEFLPGKNMKGMWPIGNQLDAQLVEESGSYLAKIHSVKTGRFGFFNNKIAKKQKKLVGIHHLWSEHIFAALDTNLNYLVQSKIINPSQQKKIIAIFNQGKSLLTLRQGVLIQNDLADWNQLVEKNRISGILDWDECYSGDPVADFSAWSVFFSIERMQFLKQGYLKLAELPDDFEIKFHLYRLRYLISKIMLRQKKLKFKKDKFMQQLLEHGLKAIAQELKWFKI